MLPTPELQPSRPNDELMKSQQSTISLLVAEKAGLVTQLREMERREVELVQRRNVEEERREEELKRGAEEGKRALKRAEEELKSLRESSSNDVSCYIL